MTHPIISLPSPNFNDRPGGEGDITALVLHYTGMEDVDEVKQRLCCAEAGVSAHYLVDEEGQVFQHVDEKKRAWHAGVSAWGGRENVNDYSVGIEIQNPGHEWGYRPFPEAQMNAVKWLSGEIVKRYNILPHNVIGHSDIAPERKEDPGELFGWAWLSEHGVGLWVDNVAAVEWVEDAASVAALRESFEELGYATPAGEGMNDLLRLVIIAFQRHFRPMLINAEWDGECQAIIAKLIEMK